MTIIFKLGVFGAFFGIFKKDEKNDLGIFFRSFFWVRDWSLFENEDFGCVGYSKK
jgi:hypothetical protein